RRSTCPSLSERPHKTTARRSGPSMGSQRRRGAGLLGVLPAAAETLIAGIHRHLAPVGADLVPLAGLKVLRVAAVEDLERPCEVVAVVERPGCAGLEPCRQHEVG